MVGAVAGTALGIAGKRAAGTPAKTSGIYRIVQIVTLTASGSIVVPAGATLADVYATGGGGAGGGTTTWQGSPGNGGGGGAGALDIVPAVPVQPGQTLAVTIGAGGIADISGRATGGNGSPTTLSLGSLLIASAAPGQGGLQYAGSPGAGGPGGAQSVTPGHAGSAGLNGAQADSVSNSHAPGGVASNLIAGGSYGSGGYGGNYGVQAAGGAAGVITIIFRSS